MSELEKRISELQSIIRLQKEQLHFWKLRCAVLEASKAEENEVLETTQILDRQSKIEVAVKQAVSIAANAVDDSTESSLQENIEKEKLEVTP